MKNNFLKTVNENPSSFYSFMHFLSQKDKKLCVTGNIFEYLNEFAEKHSESAEKIRSLMNYCQESVAVSDSVYLDVREKISQTRFYQVNTAEPFTEEITTKEYLMIKESIVNPEGNNNILNLDFSPFYGNSPFVRDTKNIGQGVEYLNRYLSSQMFNDTTKWKNLLFNFLHLHKYDGRQLILNDRIKDADELNEQLDKAMNLVRTQEDDVTYDEIKHDLQDLGFEPGLGKNVKELYKSFNLLDNILNSPDHQSLTEFISRIPMIFKIAIISPHGFFSQTSAMGLPDTGGQVVYILDQVKALEKALIESLEQAGLNVLPKIIVLTRLIPNPMGTDCNKRLEKIYNTKNSWILRVPFREHNKEVTDNWISRFEIWPYIEEFTEDSYIELLAEFGARPDLIIGNYSDGNLVSYLLAQRFKVTQCCIAHALEKSKYLYSALYWKDIEQYYHFSLQFTADLIAINSANFLISSSYQEIAGTEESMGQYESYKHFTMPGLYRVENGVDPKHTKFNIVSPGVNQNVFFPPSQSEDRIEEVTQTIDEMFFENVEEPYLWGKLADPDKTPLFAMSRLDKIKNITGLIRWFGESKELQKKANLIIAAGRINPEESSDNEEKEQINLTHELLEKYQLHDKVRWIGRPLRKDESGEAYRRIAEKHGAFVQPALFEGFGLTVIEAMTTGVPVFATKYGGPLEIIEHKRNGFHIDPAIDQEAIKVLEEFIKKMSDEPEYWEKVSQSAINRVEEKYNWPLYTEKLLSQSKIYGFWKYSTDMENKGMEAYLDLLYHTVFTPRAKELLKEHAQR